ncbi:MAG: hypothetical protein WAN14_00500, partial [Candidatus Acidiferrales bacterium]
FLSTVFYFSHENNHHFSLRGEIKATHFFYAGAIIATRFLLNARAVQRSIVSARITHHRKPQERSSS